MAFSSGTTGKTTISNLALSEIGNDRNQLANFDTDTTSVSAQCRLHYDPTLEELVRMHSWNCCKTRTQLGAFEINIAIGSTITAQGGFSGDLSATGTDLNGRPTYTTGTSATNGYVNLEYDDTNSRWTLTLGYGGGNQAPITLSSTTYNPNGDYNSGSSAATGATITIVKPKFEYDYSYRIPSNSLRLFYVTDDSNSYKFLKPRVDWNREGDSIITNYTPLYACYEIAPDPSQMDSLFAKAFYTMLGSKLAVSVMGDTALSNQLLTKLYQIILPEARRVNGFERSDPPLIDSEWLEATYTSNGSFNSSYPPFSQTSYGSFT